MTRSRTSSNLELLLDLGRGSAEPLHRRLERALREAIRDGRLGVGAVLPSTRALAGQLGVSRGIVVEAYEQLTAEGYLVSRPGGSTRVTRSAAARPTAGLAAGPPPLVEFDFRPGRPEVREFPRAAWLRALRRALAAAPSDRLTYQGGVGIPELRTALAAYLNRVRGTAADPRSVVIVSGFAQGLAVAIQALRQAGARTVAVEDPSDPEYRATIAAAGLDWVAVPVDEDGLRVDRLASTDARAVVVTAVHQYPTGAVLSAERRAALLDWAERRDATIVEDDYDAEFRYDRQPIGAIQGLGPARVIYAGSASKTLAPGLRLGWLVPPDDLVGPITAAKEAADMGSAALDQLALADLLDHGELDRHLRHLRPIYRRRRDALLAALGRHLPALRPTGASAGLHVLAWLPEAFGLDDRTVTEAAVSRGIALGGLATRRVAPGPPGLIFGYGAIDEGRIDEGVRRLAGVIDDLRAAIDPVVAVYGTLRRGERNHPLLGAATPLGSGYLDGRLVGFPRNEDRPYDFPGLLPRSAATGEIRGSATGADGRVVVELYRLVDAADLSRLDALEACDPDDEARSEYLRRRLPVRDGPVEAAWAWILAGEPPRSAVPIPSGDWRDWQRGPGERPT
jgi:GntR family transcriptional regulator/MocR family aminotransferase